MSSFAWLVYQCLFSKFFLLNYLLKKQKWFLFPDWALSDTTICDKARPSSKYIRNHIRNHTIDLFTVFKTFSNQQFENFLETRVVLEVAGFRSIHFLKAAKNRAYYFGE